MYKLSDVYRGSVRYSYLRLSLVAQDRVRLSIVQEFERTITQRKTNKLPEVERLPMLS